MISRKLIRSLCNRRVQQINCTSVRHHNFDGETYSKTALSMITKEDDSQNYIEAYSAYGFRLTSGFNILGPCALFPRAVLHWNVGSAEKITPASLSLFTMLYPKLDILILGKGDWDAKIDKDIIKYLRINKINVEILPTEQACSTFNFLNSEGRVVAAGLIPPQQLDKPMWGHKDQVFLHDETIPFPPDETSDNRPKDEEFPGLNDTMEAIQRDGFFNTVAEIERSGSTIKKKDKKEKSGSEKE